MKEIMKYNEFRNVLNKILFGESKVDLLEKIADYPNRYMGLFRPTKPKAKILQNLLQSHEIRFGDAFEKIIKSYFEIKGCKMLPNKFKSEGLNIDLCFQLNNKVYFVELKIRDDHDSTKKRGQIQNFEKKLNVMIFNYNESKLTGIFYFIDPDLQKNKNYYEDELTKMSKDYNVKTHLFYGKEMFSFFNFDDVWDEMLKYLEKWKKELPDLPEINFDINAQQTFNEIKNINPHVYRKLFENEEIYHQIILTLFPQKKTLKFK
jgi:Holliday junction resolvase-like predicted endonuclease